MGFRKTSKEMDRSVEKVWSQNESGDLICDTEAEEEGILHMKT